MVKAKMNIITHAAVDDETMYGRFLALQRDTHPDHGRRQQREEQQRRRRRAVPVELRLSGAEPACSSSHRLRR
jgi:hypothetical protein